MIKLPRVTTLLSMLMIIVVLSGCQLRRDEAMEADPGPIAAPPTLAPLGAETALVAAQTTTTGEVTQEQAVAVIVTENQPATLAEPVVAADDAELVEVASETVAETETETVTAGEDAVVASSAEDTIIVSASDELPIGEPVASSPTYDDSASDYVAPAIGDDSVYIVQPGDTLFGVAQRYGTSVEAIVYANGLPSDIIQIGQPLTIPAGYEVPYGTPYGGVPGGQIYGQQAVPQPPYQQPGQAYQAPGYPQQPAYDQPQQGFAPAPGDQYHLVAPGETLYSIAMQYGTTVDAVAGVNGIAYPFIIQIGQPLIVPAGGANFPYQQPYQAFGQPQYDQPQPYQEYPQPYNQQQPYPDYNQQQPYGQQQPYQDYNQQQPYPDYSQQQPYPDYNQQQPYPDYNQQQPYQAYPQQPQGNFVPVPGGANTHTVSPGETLYSVALRYGTSAEALAAANGLYNPNQIYVGQVLFLP